jgi:hypothetical protein
MAHQQKRQAMMLVFFAVPVTGKREPIGSREAIYCRRSPENARIFFGSCTKGHPF